MASLKSGPETEATASFASPNIYPCPQLVRLNNSMQCSKL